MKNTSPDEVRATGENRIAQEVCNAIIKASSHLAEWYKRWRAKK